MNNELSAYRFYEKEYENYQKLRDEFEWEIPEVFNIAWYTCDRWANKGNRIAVYEEQVDERRETYTYSELQTLTNHLAAYLRDCGVKQGDRIGVNTPQRVETLLAHLACWKIGAVSIPLSTLFGPDALAYRLNDAGAVGAIVDESSIDKFREIREELEDIHTLLTVGETTPKDDETDFCDAVEKTEREIDLVETAADDDAIILYTSGTTGDPKGVRHGHQVLLGHLPLYITAFANKNIRDDDALWTPAEWAWIASLFATVVPILYYGNAIVAYNGGEFDPSTGFKSSTGMGSRNFSLHRRRCG